MKTFILVMFLICGSSAWGGHPILHRVTPSSDLERELSYTLSVKDRFDDYRSEFGQLMDKLKGPAPEYLVRFRTKTTGKLKEMYGIGFSIVDDRGILIGLPLEMKSKWSHEDEVSVQFVILKELLKRATLEIKCGNPMNGEIYQIKLGDYTPQP